MHLRHSRAFLALIIFCIGLCFALSFAQAYKARLITVNVYTGTATLDATGAATIDVPGSIIAANSSFNYQAKSATAPMRSLYLKSALHNNQFEVAGGKPGGVIIWQLTGTSK